MDGKAPRYKRPFDIAVLLGSHVALFPIVLVVWVLVPLLIWLQDRGPIFYRQARVGRNGQVFILLKFRTMVPNAERATGPIWARPNDPRVTRVGRFLRATHLDELPQSINILRGEMSWVGPRPERPELHERFVQEAPGFEERLQVPPGIAGLAQASGAYDLPPAQKLEYDWEYMRRMSPWLDIKLLVKSVWVVFFRGERERQQGDGSAEAQSPHR